jgi:hypothetical protein
VSCDAIIGTYAGIGGISGATGVMFAEAKFDHLKAW